MDRQIAAAEPSAAESLVLPHDLFTHLVTQLPMIEYKTAIMLSRVCRAFAPLIRAFDTVHGCASGIKYVATRGRFGGGTIQVYRYGVTLAKYDMERYADDWVVAGSTLHLDAIMLTGTGRVECCNNKNGVRIGYIHPRGDMYHVTLTRRAIRKIAICAGQSWDLAESDDSPYLSMLEVRRIVRVVIDHPLYMPIRKPKAVVQKLVKDAGLIA